MSADLADAFTHFPVHKAELGNCVSPSFDSMHVYVFLALFFGHKSAPLVMCRLSALLARILQSLFLSAEAQLRLYVDDPFIMLLGSKREGHGTCPWLS